MSIDEAFIPWVEGKGVKLNGVEPEVLPGRGIGFVATRNIRTNDVVLSVPIKSVRTIDTVPKAMTNVLLPGVSVQGILAAEIALDETDDFAMWRTVLPTREDLEAGVPMMWPKELQDLLPKRAKDLMEKQATRFRREADIVLKVFPDLKREDYLYAWVLVNTRTFYNSMPKMKAYPQADRLMCMPAADLFNHADQGCQLSYTASGYNIVATREYPAGEEVYLSYGAHSNDFLLAEYGFILDTNRWDEVHLDDVILPRLNKTQREDLKSVDFLGRYALDDQTLGCHRTQVALRMLCCTPRQWQRFFDGEDDGSTSQVDVDELLRMVLDDLLGNIGETLLKVDEADVGLDSQRELLRRRWQQVETMVRRTIEQLE
ncbi:hypothetical protein AK830_g11922 [Neonectria ditissima]|uniref:SET domain-containing protein n=1 Tax=Neonectria ditissima TaxID=78410 RepID=A0A0P7B063_9HYPO|nr:hypothetical protein AK830_g11922 [Neonectria ditissima]